MGTHGFVTTREYHPGYIRNVTRICLRLTAKSSRSWGGGQDFRAAAEATSRRHWNTLLPFADELYFDLLFVRVPFELQ